MIEGYPSIGFYLVKRLICKSPVRCECNPVRVADLGNFSLLLGFQLINRPFDLFPPPRIPGIKLTEIKYSSSGSPY
jgi:hypothetical protein